MAKKINVEFLVQKGIITEDQLDKAKDEVRRTGMSIEKALERLGFISEIDIAQAMAETLGIPFMDLSDYLINPEVLKSIPEETAKKFNVIPLFKIGDTLTVAMSDPEDIVAIDEIRKESKIDSVEPVLSTQEMIQKIIDQYYGTLGNTDDILKGLTKEKLEESRKSTEGKAETIEAPVIKLANLIIMQAVKDRASDVHIEPSHDEVLIRYRIDGILHEVKKIPKHLQSALASRVKIMAGLDITETRIPQDGRIQLRMENKNLDLRISTFPTMHGENIVIRILDKAVALITLPELGFQDRDFKEFSRLIQHPNGIILVTGPTGSGKTTTLYAALSTINSMEKNIITIEDPVEYEIPLIRQTQVNVKAGLTFANGLRSILRQDPDIIMVGEIRDRETAEIAIQASLTGHLVFSTLHTNDAAGALTRLLDMGIESFLIASSIIGVLAQRLVRVICPRCKEIYIPPAETLGDIGLDKNTDFYHGKGCSSCKKTGFSGRIGIFELLIINDDIKNLITAKSSADEIKKTAITSGMRVLFEDGIEKVKSGITTVEELLRVTEER